MNRGILHGYIYTPFRDDFSFGRGLFSIIRRQFIVVGDELKIIGGQFSVVRGELSVVGCELKIIGGELSVVRAELKVVGSELSACGDELSAARRKLSAGRTAWGGRRGISEAVNKLFFIIGLFYISRGV